MINAGSTSGFVVVPICPDGGLGNEIVSICQGSRGRDSFPFDKGPAGMRLFVA